MKKYLTLPAAIALCLTLGLAPYVPEPHIVGKIRWVSGGAIGMKAEDWFDLVFHGSAWFFLIVVLVRKFFVKTPPQ
jgi:hypothetical protein